MKPRILYNPATAQVFICTIYRSTGKGLMTSPRGRTDATRDFVEIVDRLNAPQAAKDAVLEALGYKREPVPDGTGECPKCGYAPWDSGGHEPDAPCKEPKA